MTKGDSEQPADSKQSMFQRWKKTAARKTKAAPSTPSPEIIIQQPLQQSPPTPLPQQPQQPQQQQPPPPPPDEIDIMKQKQKQQKKEHERKTEKFLNVVNGFDDDEDDEDVEDKPQPMVDVNDPEEMQKRQLEQEKQRLQKEKERREERHFNIINGFSDHEEDEEDEKEKEKEKESQQTATQPNDKNQLHVFPEGGIGAFSNPSVAGTIPPPPPHEDDALNIRHSYKLPFASSGQHQQQQLPPPTAPPFDQAQYDPNQTAAPTIPPEYKIYQSVVPKPLTPQGGTRDPNAAKMAEMFASKAFGVSTATPYKVKPEPFPSTVPPATTGPPGLRSVDAQQQGQGQGQGQDEPRSIISGPTGWSAVEESMLDSQPVFDSPTSSLTQSTSDTMYDITKEVKDKIKSGRQLAWEAIEFEENAMYEEAEQKYVDALTILIPMLKLLDKGPEHNRDERKRQKRKIQKESNAMMDHLEMIKTHLKNLSPPEVPSEIPQFSPSPSTARNTTRSVNNTTSQHHGRHHQQNSVLQKTPTREELNTTNVLSGRLSNESSPELMSRLETSKSNLPPFAAAANTPTANPHVQRGGGIQHLTSSNMPAAVGRQINEFPKLQPQPQPQPQPQKQFDQSRPEYPHHHQSQYDYQSGQAQPQPQPQQPKEEETDDNDYGQFKHKASAIHVDNMHSDDDMKPTMDEDVKGSEATRNVSSFYPEIQTHDKYMFDSKQQQQPTNMNQSFVKHNEHQQEAPAQMNESFLKKKILMPQLPQSPQSSEPLQERKEIRNVNGADSFSLHVQHPPHQPSGAGGTAAAASMDYNEQYEYDAKSISSSVASNRQATNMYNSYERNNNEQPRSSDEGGVSRTAAEVKLTLSNNTIPSPYQPNIDNNNNNNQMDEEFSAAMVSDESNASDFYNNHNNNHSRNTSSNNSSHSESKLPRVSATSLHLTRNDILENQQQQQQQQQQSPTTKQYLSPPQFPPTPQVFEQTDEIEITSLRLNQSINDNSNKAIEQCVICKNKAELRSRNCGHGYCSSCGDQTVAVYGKCPLPGCQAPLSMEAFEHIIY